MTTANIFSHRQDRLWLHGLLSFLTIFLLALIDNGFVIFTELSQPAVWIFFTIMSAIVLFGQALTQQWLLFAYKGNYKTLLTAFIGIPLGLLFLYTLLYLLRSA